MLLAKIALTAAATALYGARHAGATSYVATDVWTYDNFLDGFTFYTGADPSDNHGFVSYVNETTAKELGLFDLSYGFVYITGEYQYPQSSSGVKSVRLQSKKTYNNGLFVIDLKRIPFGDCTFPTFGTSGPKWPENGSIDIISGINNHTGNEVTVRTSSGCQMMVGGTQTGIVDCGNPEGCGTGGQTTVPYGSTLMDNGGGVYVMEWTNSIIQTWFMQPGSFNGRADQLADEVDTSVFGEPFFSLTPTSCGMPEHFKDHQIIIDLNFCGSWAASEYSPYNGDSICKELASTSDFVSAYWIINAVGVYSPGAWID